MSSIDTLLANNKKWRAQMERDRPGFFDALAHQQRPRYLWIGCADSRVPANEIIGLAPGEVFVHRNVANLVVHSDLNCLAVLDFALNALEITDVIVCGVDGLTCHSRPPLLIVHRCGKRVRSRALHPRLE